MTTKTTPVFIPGTYRVTFDRIGRSRPAPLTVEATSGEGLADRIAKYAKGHLGSRFFDVDVCHDGKGFITAGVRAAGDFTWERIP